MKFWLWYIGFRIRGLIFRKQRRDDIAKSHAARVLIDDVFHSEISPIVVDGKTESVIINFREDIPIVRMRKFVCEGVGRIFVYVGDDGLPVALQLVDPLPQHGASHTYRGILYSMACKMVGEKP